MGVDIRYGPKIFNTELIIFDKDGTLVDFKSTWLPIFEDRLQNIIKLTGLSSERANLFIRKCHRAFGITLKRKHIDPKGPFPYSTRFEDEIIFADTLYSIKIPWEKARENTRRAIDISEKRLSRVELARPVRNLKRVIETIYGTGIKLAIATADHTEIAEQTMERFEIKNYFHAIVGSDTVKNGKPHPEMIEYICKNLSVTKEKTVIIGDTITDMIMGRKARVGLLVGVIEGGVAGRRDLMPLADVVINSIREIKPA